MSSDSRLRQLVEWVRATSSEARALVVPVSGGSDSALCFWLCCEAWGKDKVTGVHAGSNLRAQKWFDSVGHVRFMTTPGEYAEREEMRWARFLAMSLENRAWLVGSRNRVEDLLGTYSLASRVATYLPLVNIWKTEVLDLCRLIGVPEPILESSLRADPDCGRPPELAEIPIWKIEMYLRRYIANETDFQWGGILSPAEVYYLRNMVARNSFKKTLPVRGPEF